MTREVFAGRDGEFITIGEMPGVTPEQARLYTDPARSELNMVNGTYPNAVKNVLPIARGRAPRTTARRLAELHPGGLGVNQQRGRGERNPVRHSPVELV